MRPFVKSFEPGNFVLELYTDSSPAQEVKTQQGGKMQIYTICKYMLPHASNIHYTPLVILFLGTILSTQILLGVMQFGSF